MNTVGEEPVVAVEILEGISQEKFSQVNLNISFNSQYNQLLFQPRKALNFGPILYNEVKTKEFEIVNTGLFELNFFIYDFQDEAQHQQILDHFHEIFKQRQAVFEEGGKK